MRIKISALIIALTAISLFIIGCDMLGMGGDQPAPPLPVMAPPVAPGMPQAAPPAQPAVPGALPVPGAPAPAAPQVPGAPIQTPVAPAPLVPGAPAPIAAPGAPPVPAPAMVPTGDPIIDTMNTIQAASAADKTPTSSLMKGTLNKGKEAAYNVQLPGPPYCHTYIAVGTDAVTNMDISVTSPAGTVEAADATTEKTAVVPNHCPTMPGLYTVKVKMTDGTGEFGVQVFSK